jgi:nucleoside-diphosphate-sugar epimerase
VTGLVNIGNPKEFSMLELASMVIDLTGSHSCIVHRPCPEDDPEQRRPDISRAQYLLDWKPRTMLKDGGAAHYGAVGLSKAAISVSTAAPAAFASSTQHPSIV